MRPTNTKVIARRIAAFKKYEYGHARASDHRALVFQFYKLSRRRSLRRQVLRSVAKKLHKTS